MIRTTPTGARFVLFYITRLLLVGASLELLIGSFVMIETLTSRFGHFTANDKLRFAVNDFMLPVCPHLGLKIRGCGSSRLPCLFSFIHSLLF